MNRFPARVYHLAQFPETIKAVAMAKCSRSKNTFRADAESMTVDKADKFHEQIVVNFGHESVADMSIGSAVMEDVSILLAEDVFDLQTGKFQGKSSRYVPYSRERVVQPWDDAESEAVYQSAIAALFSAYETLQAPLTEMVKKEWPDAKADVVRARVLDSLRGLLPLGALTNFATRLSGRDTSELVRRLSVHPLAEGRQLAEQVKVTGEEELSPTMIRHATGHPLHAAQREAKRRVDAGHGRRLMGYLEQTYGETYVKLRRFDRDGVERVCSAFLFEATGMFQDIPAFGPQRRMLLDELQGLLGQRERRQDPMPNALRATRYHFEISADFGVWKDLRRHRRNELYRAPFTAAYGYIVPEDLETLGEAAVETYCEAMDTATDAWYELVRVDPYRAQYVIAHNHIQRFVMDLDAEQLHYVGELRTAPGGHITYRRAAAEMVRLAREVHPDLFQSILVHPVGDLEQHH